VKFLPRKGSLEKGEKPSNHGGNFCVRREGGGTENLY